MTESADWECEVSALIVKPKGKPRYSEGATNISIQDESAGEYVIVTQESGSISIDRAEWPKLRAAINKMIRACR